MASDGIEAGAVIERVLPVKLTQPELVERGQRMALAELKIETLKSERKMLNARISEQVELRASLGHVIDLALEDRDVRCQWSADYGVKKWLLHRLDTGERLESRDMTARDLQTSIPGTVPATIDAAPLTDPDGIATLDWIDDVKSKGKAKRKSKRSAAPPPKAKQSKRPKARAHAQA